jgi:uncharacterized membrane protein
MREFFNSLYSKIDIVVSVLDVVSLGVILWGVFVVFSKFIIVELFHKDDLHNQYKELRKTMMLYFVTGLDFMIVADLVALVESRSPKNMLILAALALVRAALYFIMHHETKHFGGGEKEPLAKKKTLSETHL